MEAAAQGYATRKRYLLRRSLGTGSMGTVYQAWDRLTAQDVAFKQVKANALNNKIDSMASRLALAHEFQVLASLRHPNVIGVLDYGFDEDKQPYFTMTYLDQAQNIREAAVGKTLRERLYLFAQLLHALVYLQRRGIVHRDLKPDNVLVTKNGQVRVLDFGLALQANQDHMEEVVGTLAYMAPEVITGELPTHLSDLYAVGVIAYELFAEQDLFDLTSTRQLVQDIVTRPPDMTPIERLDFSDLNAIPFATREVIATENVTTRMSKATGKLKTDVMLPVRKDKKRKTQNFRLNPNLNRTDVQLERTDIFGEDANPLVTIIRGLLAKQPYLRYQTAQQVLNDLERALQQPLIVEEALLDSFLEAAKFVGREAELQQLGGALDAALARKGSLWLVGGESGVGKSRLMDEVRTLGLVKGMLVVRGQAAHQGAGLFQLWRDPLRRLLLNVEVSDENASLLKQIVPDIARLLGREVPDPILLDSSTNQKRLARAVREIFMTHFRQLPDPILVILEDLQWASTESLEILQQFITIMDHVPLMIVADYRHDERPDLPVYLPGSQRLELRRLDAASVGELAYSMLGEAGRDPYIVEMLHRETEGNIFFLVEVVRALVEEVGDLQHINIRTLPARVLAGGVDKIIQRRLDQVPEYYRPLMRVAAVAGRRIDFNLLQAIYPLMPLDEWLTVCVHAAVIVGQDEKWQFAHDKLREHVLANLSFEEAQMLHRLVAENVERLYAYDLKEHAEALAYHWRYALEPARERYYSLMVGQQAYDRSAFKDARPFLERALLLATPEDMAQKIHINILLGSVYEHLSDYETAMQYLKTALALAEQSGDERQAAAARFNFGWINLRLGRLDETAQNAEQVLAIARQLRDDRTLMEALSLQGVVSVMRGEPLIAERHLLDALGLARQLDDQMNQGSILNTLGAAAEAQEKIEEAQFYLLEAYRIAERIGHWILAANVGGNLGRLFYNQCHYDEAQAHFEKAYLLFKQTGSMYGEALAAYYLGFIDIQQRTYDSAREFLLASLRLSRKIGAQSVTLMAMSGMAQLLSVTGEPDRAAALLTMISYHPATEHDPDLRRRCEEVRSGLVLDEITEQAALLRGQMLNLDQVVTEILEKEAA